MTSGSREYLKKHRIQRWKVIFNRRENQTFL